MAGIAEGISWQTNVLAGDLPPRRPTPPCPRPWSVCACARGQIPRASQEWFTCRPKHPRVNNLGGGGGGGGRITKTPQAGNLFVFKHFFPKKTLCGKVFLYQCDFTTKTPVRETYCFCNGFYKKNNSYPAISRALSHLVSGRITVYLALPRSPVHSFSVRFLMTMLMA